MIRKREPANKLCGVCHKKPVDGCSHVDCPCRKHAQEFDDLTAISQGQTDSHWLARGATAQGAYKRGGVRDDD